MATLAVGRKAPDFTLATDRPEPFHLAGLAGSAVVVFFYPEDDTEGCTIENLEFSRLLPDFEALGVRVLGISPDTVEKHCRFRDKHGLKVPLAADPSLRTIKRYGAWGPKKLFGHAYDGVIRSTFLIDPRGRIAAIWKVTRIRGHAQAALGAARTLAAAAP
jgi:peroxiredoxin Q/BCP